MATGQNTAFGTLLRRYRTLAGLTQEQLAERAGVSARAITALERGVNRMPQRETLRLLVDALDLAPDDRSILEAATRQRPHDLIADTIAAHHQIQAARAPLVGREREVALLEHHASGSGPSLLLLSGEPGIGKSRLLWEAAQLASARGMTILEGGCHWNTCQEPYAPVMSALERYLALASPAQRRAHLRGCEWLARMLPELEAITGVPRASWPLTPEQERRLTFAAVARFLSHIAGPSGILLIIDDLQWIGPDVSDLLLYLTRSAADVGLRLIAAYRDTDVNLPLPLATTIVNLVRDGEARRIDLGPLPDGDAHALLARLLGDVAEEDERTRALVLARAEGVPFYLVSCAQALRSGALDRGPAADVPWDVEQSIRQRVLALPGAAQELIAVAAVVGQEASGKLLARAAGFPIRETLAGLEVACRARLLIEDETGTYRFTHNLIWEVVVADMGTTRRQVLHRRIAEALEQDNREQWLDALVYHYTRSDEQEKALSFLEQAVGRALAQRAHGTAEIFYWQQVRLLRELGHELDAARVYEALGDLLRILARHDEALEALEHAAQTYRHIADVESLGRVTAQIGWVHARRGTPAVGRALLTSFLMPLRPDSLSARVLAELYVALGELEFVSCHYVAQLRAVEQAAQYARTEGNMTLLARARMRRGVALLSLGHLEESRPALEEALGLAEEARDGWALCRAQNALGILYRVRGQPGEAQRWTEQARAIAEQQGDPTAISFMLYDLGEIAFCRGEWQQARAAFERSEALMRELSPSWISAYALLGLGRLSLAEGRWEAAQRDLDDAIARAESINELQVLRFAHSSLAERDLLEGHPERALARLEPLLDRDDQQELYVTMLLPLLAWAYHELGDVVRAEDTSARAIGRARAQRFDLALTDALRIAAVIQSGQGKWHEARTLLNESLRVARRMSSFYAMAKALYIAGQLHVASGKPQPARVQLEHALLVCLRLGERLYASHIEQALADIHGARQPLEDVVGADPRSAP